MTPVAQDGDPLLDAARFGWFQARAIVICALVALLDGFDTQSIAFAAPVMAREWALPIADFAPVFAAGLFGGLVGGALLGRLADRFGRKSVLYIALALVAIGSGITVGLSERTTLIAARLIAGFGLGGALPCVIALTAEYAPSRLRTSLTTAMFCAFPFGAALGAVIASPLLVKGEWRAVYWIGTAAPVLAIPLVALFVPESLGFLRRRGRKDAMTRIVVRLGGDVDFVSAAKADLPNAANAPLSAIFGDGRLAATLALAIAFLVSLLLVYLLVNWVPSFAVAAGVGGGGGAGATAVLNIAGIVGGLAIAWIGDRTHPWRAIPISYAVAAVVCAGLALVARQPPPVLLFCAAAGLLCVGAQMSLISLAAAIYPSNLRAGAIGLLMGIGRIGAIFGPLLGGSLLSGETGFSRLSWTVALGSLICAAVLFLFRPSRKSASEGGSVGQCSHRKVLEIARPLA